MILYKSSEILYRFGKEAEELASILLRGNKKEMEKFFEGLKYVKPEELRTLILETIISRRRRVR